MLHLQELKVDNQLHNNQTMKEEIILPSPGQFYKYYTITSYDERIYGIHERHVMLDILTTRVTKMI